MILAACNTFHWPDVAVLLGFFATICFGFWLVFR